jgi:heme-degrading monooxygenase HmoA
MGIFETDSPGRGLKSLLINPPGRSNLGIRQFQGQTLKTRGCGSMAIKVIITRKVARGKEKDLLPLLMELRTRAMGQRGYISGETLKGVSDPDEFLVISTWNSLDDWKGWEQNPERQKIQEKIDAVLEQTTIAKVYLYG